MTDETKNVIRIFPNVIAPESVPVEVSQISIEVLEEALEEAKAGKIKGVVIAKTMANGHGQYSIGGRFGMSGLGALSVAAARIEKDLIDG